MHSRNYGSWPVAVKPLQQISTQTQNKLHFDTKFLIIWEQNTHFHYSLHTY